MKKRISEFKTYFKWKVNDEDPLVSAEININKGNSLFLLVTGIYFIVVGILVQTGVYSRHPNTELFMYLSALELIVPFIICTIVKGKGRWLKYVIVIFFSLGIAAPSVISKSTANMLFVMPLIISGRYFSKRLFATSTGLMITSAIGIPFLSKLYGTITDSYFETFRFYSLPAAIIIALVSGICFVTSRRLTTVFTNEAKIMQANARIDSELKLANEIQINLVPTNYDDFNKKEIDIYATMHPSKEVGGDFYDFVRIDNYHVAVLIADVSGKGVPAALFMSRAKATIKIFIQLGLAPSEIFNRVNKTLLEGNELGLFVTAWLGIIETTTGKVTYVNAGHCAPLVYQEGKYTFLKGKTNLVLAALEETKYSEQTFILKPNDRLFLYTDGITEAFNKEKEQFGESRLLKYANGNKKVGIHSFVDNLLKEVNEFSNGVEQFDDITMLCVRLNQLHGRESLLERSFPAKDDYLDAANQFIFEALTRHNVSEKVLNEISLSIEEIFVNIAHYAYPLGTGEIKLSLSLIENNVIQLAFIDSGIPFNPLEKEDPDVSLSADERQIGGLGIFLVKKLMDDVSYKYENGQNILTIKKKF